MLPDRRSDREQAAGDPANPAADVDADMRRGPVMPPAPVYVEQAEHPAPRLSLGERTWRVLLHNTGDRSVGAISLTLRWDVRRQYPQQPQQTCVGSGNAMLFMQGGGASGMAQFGVLMPRGGSRPLELASCRFITVGEEGQAVSPPMIQGLEVVALDGTVVAADGAALSIVQ